MSLSMNSIILSEQKPTDRKYCWGWKDILLNIVQVGISIKNYEIFSIKDWLDPISFIKGFKLENMWMVEEIKMEDKIIDTLQDGTFQYNPKTGLYVPISLNKSPNNILHNRFIHLTKGYFVAHITNEAKDRAEILINEYYYGKR